MTVTDFLKEILYEAGTAFKQYKFVLLAHRYRFHRHKLTGSIPGAGTTNILLMVTVSTPKLAIKLPPALKGQK